MKKISIVSVIIVVIVILTTFINYLVYNNYYNKKIIDVVNQMVEENDNIEVEEIAKILKNPKDSDKNILERYGYSANDLYLVGDIKDRIIINICINICVFLFISLILIYMEKRKNSKRLNEINNLITFLEKINSGDYDIDLNKYSESDFSKLRNEIFKTTILLKEHTEFLNKDRVILKDNLADVSHQIRTPLTSISLMIESIIEDKDMSKTKKDEFLNKIYIQTDKINYLTESLLKLSKFDAKAIEFKKDNVIVYDLLEKVQDSLEYLIIEKNININIIADKNIKIKCDEKWQEEALMNIVKNCIEYSEKNGIIDINVEDNNFYTKIVIKDYGLGISKEELKKIFIRFHKSKKSNGFGIGLNLSKTIIEKDNGMIKVESVENEYTKFIIKYMK